MNALNNFWQKFSLGAVSDVIMCVCLNKRVTCLSRRSVSRFTFSFPARKMNSLFDYS